MAYLASECPAMPARTIKTTVATKAKPPKITLKGAVKTLGAETASGWRFCAVPPKPDFPELVRLLGVERGTFVYRHNQSCWLIADRAARSRAAGRSVEWPKAWAAGIEFDLFRLDRGCSGLRHEFQKRGRRTAPRVASRIRERLTERVAAL